MSTNEQSEEAIFARALEADSLEAALQIVRTETEDARLRERLERLVGRYFESQGPLDVPVLELEMTLEQESKSDSAVGTTIGPYKLLQQIGEGGMGSVYMAEQTDPVQRRVAIKIIKPGMDSKQVIARFEAERQALAMMDHPNIAKVLDVGTTEQGRPYFVMELVKGVPITQYCDSQHLSPRERLELFMPVCQAVQHAHQKGIIHRDLKPSNVLVALYDGRPVPKVIDFGVAKATGGRLTDKTMFTQLGQVVGTLEYMSPEQAHLNQLDVDTRSDIYSLGTMLYELLTGTTPFTRQRLRSAALDEVMRIIRDEDPPSPSTRVSTTENIASIAANRHVEPKKLSSLMRGELDWIVMKSLEKDRSRRYETANGLAADLQRFLDDEPVTACPPSARYKFGKFVRRNKVAVIAGSAIAGALVFGLFAATWGYFTARDAQRVAVQQRDEALTQRRRAREAFDAVLSPDGLGWLKTQEELLPEQKKFLEKALSYYKEFAADTATEAEGKFLIAKAHQRVGQTLSVLDQPVEALQALQQAIDLFGDLVEEQPKSAANFRELAAAYNLQADVLDSQGTYKRQIESWRQAIHFQQAAIALDQTDDELKLELCRYRGNLARYLKGDGDFAGSEFEFRSGLSLVDEVLENQPQDLSAYFTKLDLLKGLAFLQYYQLAVPAEGEASFQQSIEICISLLPRVRRESDGLESQIKLFRMLESAHRMLNNHDDAIKYGVTIVEHLESKMRQYPAASSYRFEAAYKHSSLAETYHYNNQLEEAESGMRRALELTNSLRAQSPQSSKIDYLFYEVNASLAELLDDQNRFEESDALWRDATTVEGDDARLYACIRHARSRAEAGKTEEALQVLKKVGSWKSIDDPTLLMEYAATHAFCIANLQDQNDPQIDALGHEAVEMLRRAADFSGHGLLSTYERASPFKTIRDRPDFQELLRELRAMRDANGNDKDPEPASASGGR